MPVQRETGRRSSPFYSTLLGNLFEDRSAHEPGRLSIFITANIFDLTMPDIEGIAQLAEPHRRSGFLAGGVSRDSILGVQSHLLEVRLIRTVVTHFIAKRFEG